MKCMNPEGLLVEDIEKTGDYSIKLTDDIKMAFKQRVQKMITYYQNSDEFKSITPQNTAAMVFDSKINTVSWWMQTYKVCERGFKNEMRNPMDVRMKLISSIFFGVVNTIVFEGVILKK